MFTLLAEIADIAFHNEALVYGLLFKAASETMLTIAADPKHLGAHRHHRRAPYLGIGDDAPSACPHDRAGRRHRAGRKPLGLVATSLPATGEVLGKLCRRLFLTRPVALHDAGRLAFLRHLAPVQKKRWVVYAKAPFAGPEAVLAFLSRYTRRVAISNRRLIAFDESRVTFRYKDYRRDGTNRQQVMTLAVDEFIRRFLLHVLPRGFHRIRHYGLLAGSARKANLARACKLLNVAPPPEDDTPGEPRAIAFES